MKSKYEVISSFYPELNISGYTSVDGTIEFYNRINSIINSSMVVLDFGAGRAAWYEDDPCSFRKKVRLLKGKVNKIIGCDVDDAILTNKSIDESVVIKNDAPLPFKDNSFDIIISDYTFEHINNTQLIGNEFYRILKKGGWICARTPNKYSIVSIITRLVKSKYHSKVLRYAQPDRKSIDVFPTAFKLNSMRDISKHFNSDKYDNYTYRYEAEPAYHFNKKSIFFIFLLINKLTPSFMNSNLFIFLRKK